jgi:hypothetical protein
MKNLLILFLAVSFISCNPFITKELRRKKKCNKKLERVINKCPELLKADTIRDTVSIMIPEVRIDSFIVIEKDSAEIDSLVNLIQDQGVREIIKQYITKYVPFKDTLRHEIDGYTFLFYVDGQNIRYEVKKPLEVVKIENEIIVPIVRPVELTTFEKVLDFFSRFWWWFVIGLILFILGRTIKNYFF